VTDPSPAFFTVDAGGATTAAALIGRLAGRWRLLAAGAVPASIATDVLLADLVGRVNAADDDLLAEAGPWQQWARVESRTAPPPSVLLAATSEARLQELELTFGDAGWRVVLRVTPDHLAPLTVARVLLDRHLTVVAIAAGDPVEQGERAGLADLSAFIGSFAMRRPELRVVLVGGAVSEEASLPPAQILRARSPAVVAEGDEGSLASLVERLRLETVAGNASDRTQAGGDVPGPPAEAGPAGDGRVGFQRAVASLAAVLDLRIEGVDIGLDGGTHVLAGPMGIERRAIRADAGLVPLDALDDERWLDQIAGWTTVHEDGFALRDRIRNLRLAPWRDAAGDGSLLRVGAARAALDRLGRGWAGPREEDAAASGAAGSGAPDLLVLSGGAFAVAPAPVVALTVLDTLRHPGGVALALDHARVLAPLGTLGDEADRRRILTDLADDLLAPLGSAIVAGGLRGGRRGTLRLTSEGGTSVLPLVAGSVQVVDLPPGIAATAQLESADDLWVGVHARSVAIDVVGGLGGLLVDTRETPLRLPDRAERRRQLLESWERPLWIGGDW